MNKRIYDKLNNILLETSNTYFESGKFFAHKENKMILQTTEESLLGKTQNYLKRRGDLYYFLLDLFSPVYGLAAKKILSNLIKQCRDEDIIINIGSGPKRFKQRDDIINIDFFPFDEVDIVTDAMNIPLKSNTVDLIINTAFLEHVVDPMAVVKEMKRLVKPKGTVFCFLPFMLPYHAAPNDYYRWTLSGARELFSCFDNIKIENVQGPMSAFLWIFIEFVSILFSFRSKTVHDILFLFLMVLLSPLKYADSVLRKFPNAEKIAGGFCIIASKDR